jgi:hypothetical protein
LAAPSVRPPASYVGRDRVHAGSEGFLKKLIDGLEETYRQIKADKDNEEARREAERLGLNNLKGQARIEAMEEQMRQKRNARRAYTQPLEASWREFIEFKGWTPIEVDELPDDWVCSEWLRYSLMNRYGIPLPGRGGF